MLEILFYSREGQLTIFILVFMAIMMVYLFGYFISNMNKASKK
jgi:hypothetical protein